jgi:hypothetical protein
MAILRCFLLDFETIRQRRTQSVAAMTKPLILTGRAERPMTNP